MAASLIAFLSAMTSSILYRPLSVHVDYNGSIPTAIVIGSVSLSRASIDPSVPWFHMDSAPVSFVDLAALRAESRTARPSHWTSGDQRGYSRPVSCPNALGHCAGEESGVKERRLLNACIRPTGSMTGFLSAFTEFTSLLLGCCCCDDLDFVVGRPSPQSWMFQFLDSSFQNLKSLGCNSFGGCSLYELLCGSQSTQHSQSKER
jgi:hypothetical protein